ncbi:MAG: type II toxin-antitoxin system VapC family toxin [Caulobacteraceae bacterium]
MIVIDTSALMAVLLDEAESKRCIEVMAQSGALAISAGTLAEAMIVAGRHGARSALDRLIGQLRLEIVPVTATDARRVGDAYDLWGKGVHPAGLNFGDCFAYVLAKERGGRLLFVGQDFARTDVASA